MKFSPSTRAYSHLIWIPLFFIFALLAFYALGEQEADKDEIATYRFVIKPFDELVVNRLERGHAPLYFILLKGWLGLTEVSYAMMIVPSVVFGWLTFVGMVWLARYLGWGRLSWLIGLALALHPTFLYFARYARPWGGVLCIWVWILVCWVRLLDADTPSRHRGIWGTAFWALGIIGALWNHSLIILWVLLGLGTALIPGLRRHATRRIWWGFIIAILAHVCMTGVVLAHAAGLTAVAWIKHPGWDDIAELVLEWFGGRHASLYTRRDGVVMVGNKSPVILALSLLALILFGMIDLYFRRNPLRHSSAPAETPLKRSATQLVCLTGWVPALILLISPLFGQPVALFRYGIIALPGLLLLACRGLRWLPGRKWPIAALSLILILNLANYRPSIRERRSAKREALKKLEKKFNPETDVLAVFSEAALGASSLFLPDIPKIHVQRDLGARRSWERLVEETQKYQRMWVYDLGRRGGVYGLPQFKRLMGKADYYYDKGGCFLLCYEPVPGRLPGQPRWQDLPNEFIPADPDL